MNPNKEWELELEKASKSESIDSVKAALLKAHKDRTDLVSALKVSMEIGFKESELALAIRALEKVSSEALSLAKAVTESGRSANGK